MASLKVFWSFLSSIRGAEGNQMARSYTQYQNIVAVHQFSITEAFHLESFYT